MIKKMNILLLGITLFYVSSCTTVHKAIKHSNLETETKMSNTVFLDPVADDKKTAYIQVRNTTDKPGMNNMSDTLKHNLQSKGYRITTDPDKAHYILQVNVLQVGKSPNDPFGDLNGGFGAAVQGFGAGAVAGSFASSSYKGTLVGGLIGGTIATVADAMVEVVSYSMITDLQISEKAKNNIVRETSDALFTQGNSGSKTNSWKETTNMKKYQTRIVSVAKKVNLKFTDAEPILREGLINSISGVL